MAGRNFGTCVGLVLIAVAVSAGLNGRAQEGKPAPTARPAKVNVRDLLEKPYTFPFAVETPLKDVAAHLRKTLGIRVVLDRAALRRLDVEEADPVRLDLDGARLKVGLKLLLDQLDLTYRIEPEDDLLIVTDLVGSEDPISRLATELKTLHRDVHDIQDALNDVLDALGVEEDEGARMRKPTIIEELPDKPAEDPKALPPILPVKPDRPGA